MRSVLLACTMTLCLSPAAYAQGARKNVSTGAVPLAQGSRKNVPKYAPGQVVVMVEPNVFKLSPGQIKQGFDQVAVGDSGVKKVLQRHHALEVTKLFPDWKPPIVPGVGIRVHTPHRHDVTPPDALTDMSNLMLVQLPDSENVDSAVAQLNRSTGVVYAEPNSTIQSLSLLPSGTMSAPKNHFSLNPNDPDLNWGLSEYAQGYGINAPDAWQIQTGSPAVRIALLDTGIDPSNPDLGGKIAGQYDFVNGSPNAYPDLNQDFPYHGIATAGLAAAQTNDGVGTAGVCGGFGPSNSGCQILAAKILGHATLFNNNVTEWLGLTSVTADGVNWATNNGAKVLSNSWCAPGWQTSQVNISVHDAFRNAYLSGAVVTAAMGNTQGLCNQNSPTDMVAPAAFSDILMAVGSTDQTGQRISKQRGYTWEPGKGPNISVVAPGTGLYYDDFGSSFPYGFAGTSASTPLVSGVAGLVFSQAAAQGLAFTPMDVRKLIELTAHDIGAVGWDDSTGHGIIDAGKALQTLQPPNTVVFGTAGASPAGCYATLPTTNWTWWADFNVTEAQRCEVRQNVTFASTYYSTPVVWGRPASTGGITPSNPNSQIFYTDVVPGSVTTTGATLRTWVYHRWDLGGHDMGWYPAAPTQVTFAYAVIGNPIPYSVNAGVPALVTTKSLVQLNGSASYPSNNWLWEQSTDGGSTWGTWANSQNSQWVAYAGTYSVNWRLSANRISDGLHASNTEVTQVCIPYNAQTCNGGLQAPTVALTSGVGTRSPGSLASPTTQYQGQSGTHFGSGVWVGLVTPASDTTVVKFYSFRGAHAVSGGWPNLLDRDTVNWQAPLGRGGRLQVRSQRVPVESGVTLYHIQGELGPTFGMRNVSVALAADPDLGSPTSDTLGADDDLRLVWVRGTDSTYLGYLQLGNAPLHVRQIGSSLGDEPLGQGDEYRLMNAPVNVGAPRAEDVRFLLSNPSLTTTASGRFSTTIALMRASGRDALRTLAGIVAQKYAGDTSLASTGGPVGGEQPRVFALRQSLVGERTPSIVAGNGGQASAAAPAALQRAALQRTGITSLDYDVPVSAGAQVQIRIYNSMGRFVRTLLNQHVPAGSYHLEWDLLDAQGARVSPGVYTAIMESSGFHAARKLVVTR